MASKTRRKSPRAQTNGRNHEIQKYIDTFNKELEENECLIEVIGEKEVTEEQQSIMETEDGEETNMEDGTYFVDEDGQFYFQPSNSTDMKLVRKVSAGNNQILPDDGPKPEPEREEAGQQDGGENQEELSYVYIVTEENENEQLNEEEMFDNSIAVYDFEEDENGGVRETQLEEVEPEDSKLNILKVKAAPAVKGKKIFECIYCDYTNTKRFLLSRHMKIHSDEKPHKCTVCGKGFKTSVSLSNHENVHTGLRPHTCASCKSAFATSGELVRHVRYRHTKIRPHKCDECDYAAVEYSKLRRHKRCHSGERPYQCPHCTYASPDNFKLKRHLRVHTGERPYSCEICMAAFSQSNSLKAHRLTHFPDRKPVFQCALCPAKCGRKADLRGHIRLLHTAADPIECRKCGKRLPDRYSYKVHIRTHEGEKAFKCDVCPYASISQMHLSSHMLIHTNEKPHVCDLCDQKFRQKQLLKRHKNLYHNPDYVPPKPRPKNHDCEECGKKFIHKGNLIRHLALHDPDSNIHEENLLLKLGRKQKIDTNHQADIIIKNEETDDGQYVVFEMIQLEDDGQETVRILSPTEDFTGKKASNKETIDTKADMENCFGFNEDEDDDESQDAEENENNGEDDDDDDD